MCNFFSLVSNPVSKEIFFADWELRKRFLSGELEGSPDSHTDICHFCGLDVDKVNKYEYNPLTGVFKIDQINGKDDSEAVERQVRALDFKEIVPQLIIKKIINPFEDFAVTEATDEDIALLKEWSSVIASVEASVMTFVWASVGASVRDSVRDSIRDSVWDSVMTFVWASVGASVRDSVRDSIRDSVWDSVRASVRDSVWDSIGDSIWASARDSVWAYISSFFNIEDYGHDFSSCVKLWEKGLMPSYDGKAWRLHGKDGMIIYKWEK